MKVSFCGGHAGQVLPPLRDLCGASLGLEVPRVGWFWYMFAYCFPSVELASILSP